MHHKIYENEEQIKALEQFTNIAAHDIKSPLNNIIGLTQVFKDIYTENIDEEGNTLLNLMQNSSTKLVNMVNGILAYCKDTSLLSANKEFINITNTITSTFDILGINNQSVKYHINAPNKDIIIYTNKVAIERIFLNLIDNSIKYNPEYVTINISLKIIDNILHTTISDDGIGILSKFSSKIFNLFKTINNTDKKGDNGTGIGLAAVKSLVEGLGGTIQLKDQEKGACFLFKIPIGITMN